MWASRMLLCSTCRWPWRSRCSLPRWLLARHLRRCCAQHAGRLGPRGTTARRCGARCRAQLMDALAALRFAAAGLHGAGIFGAAMLYALVALDLAEPLLSGAELGGAGILDATVLYMLVAFLPRAESWTLLCSTCWLPWTSRSCCLPSRSSAAQASWTLPCSSRDARWRRHLGCCCALHVDLFGPRGAAARRHGAHWAGRLRGRRALRAGRLVLHRAAARRRGGQWHRHLGRCSVLQVVRLGPHGAAVRCRGAR